MTQRDGNYPKVSERGKMPLLDKGKFNTEKCIFCGGVGVSSRITIQVNWFRGDDEVAFAHHTCLRGKREEEIVEAVYGVRA